MSDIHGVYVPGAVDSAWDAARVAEIRKLLGELDSARDRIAALEAVLSSERVRAASLEESLKHVREIVHAWAPLLEGLETKNARVAELERLVRDWYVNDDACDCDPSVGFGPCVKCRTVAAVPDLAREEP